MTLQERKNAAMVLPHTLCMVSKTTGKVHTCLTTEMGKAQLVMYALRNTTPSRKSVIYETESKQITDIITGSTGFPKIEKDIYEQELYVEVE